MRRRRGWKEAKPTRDSTFDRTSAGHIEKFNSPSEDKVVARDKTAGDFMQPAAIIHPRAGGKKEERRGAILLFPSSATLSDAPRDDDDDDNDDSFVVDESSAGARREKVSRRVEGDDRQLASCSPKSRR